MFDSNNFPNSERGEFGFGTSTFYDGKAGKFVVMECCAYDEPYKKAEFEHNGSAESRAGVYCRALACARSLQTYDGSQFDYNVYEIIE